MPRHNPAMLPLCEGAVPLNPEETKIYLESFIDHEWRQYSQCNALIDLVVACRRVHTVRESERYIGDGTGVFSVLVDFAGESDQAGSDLKKIREISKDYEAYESAAQGLNAAAATLGLSEDFFQLLETALLYGARESRVPLQRHWYLRYDKPGSSLASMETLAIRAMWQWWPENLKSPLKGKWSPYAVHTEILHWAGFEQVGRTKARSTIIDQ